LDILREKISGAATPNDLNKIAKELEAHGMKLLKKGKTAEGREYSKGAGKVYKMEANMLHTPGTVITDPEVKIKAARARYNAGRMHELRNELNDAVREYNLALNLDSNNPEYTLKLADVYERQG